MAEILPASAGPLRIINAHAHLQMREMISLRLAETFPSALILEAADEETLCARLREARFDLLLIDYAATTQENFALPQRIREAGFSTNIITIADYIEDVVFVRAIRHGVRGFIYEGSLYKDLPLAIEAVVAGEIHISRFH